jgi:hypothetical protein
MSSECLKLDTSHNLGTPNFRHFEFFYFISSKIIFNTACAEYKRFSAS